MEEEGNSRLVRLGYQLQFVLLVSLIALAVSLSLSTCTSLSFSRSLYTGCIYPCVCVCEFISHYCAVLRRRRRRRLLTQSGFLDAQSYLTWQRRQLWLRQQQRHIATRFSLVSLAAAAFTDKKIKKKKTRKKLYEKIQVEKSRMR